MNSCLKRRYLSWIIVFLVTFAKSIATKSNQTITVDQLIKAHVNKLNLSPTICYGKEPISIPMENIQNELDELSEIERNIPYVRTEKLLEGPDTSIKYFYIDVVAIADYFLYKTFLEDSSKLRTQIAHLFFGAKRVYLQNKFSIPEMFDFKIVLNLVDIIIIENIDESILNKIRIGKNMTQVDGTYGLTNLTDFLINRHGKFDQGDHVTLFTALDIIREVRSDVVGIANQDFMCYPYASISIIENHMRSFDMLTLVHEIGHSLGAVHDGESNDCSAEDDYLMTPVENGYISKEKSLNKWKFSECSRKQIASYILKQFNGAFVKFYEGYADEDQKESVEVWASPLLCDCFTKTKPIQESVPDVSKTFQGADYNFADQCTLGGYEAPGDECQAANPEQLSCFVRYCNEKKRNGSQYCMPTIPYRGTSCGTDKVCEAGHCRSIEELKTVKMTFSSDLTAPICDLKPGSNLATVSSSFEPVSSSLEPVSSSLEPVSSSLEPASSSLKPESSSLKPVSSSLEKERDPEPMNSSHCLHDYGLNLVIVTLLVFGILT